MLNLFLIITINTIKDDIKIIQGYTFNGVIHICFIINSIRFINIYTNILLIYSYVFKYLLLYVYTLLFNN